MKFKKNIICYCKNKFFKKIISIKKRPKLEINYDIKKYKRNLLQCTNCNHIINDHNFDLKNLYEGLYVQKNYKSIKGIKNNFKKIISLPHYSSDNKNRVLRILNFIKKKKIKNTNLLDIGSGLGVFPYELKKKGIKVTCVEKDKYLINHLKNFLFIKTVSDLKYLKRNYNFITINKVLEHVPNVNSFLKLTIKKLKKNGYLYIEVPDYIASKLSLINREEFFIEHNNIFSEISLLNILFKFSIKMLLLERIKEPSGKFTLYIFCQR